MTLSQPPAFPVRRMAAVLVVAALAGGCAPGLGRREAPMAAVIASSDAAVRAAQGWSVFSDPVLTALEREAASANLDVQAAAARIMESRARAALAGADRHPQISADATYSRSALSASSPMVALGAPTTASNTWAAGLVAGWEMDLWGRMRSLRSAADERVQASVLDRDALSISVAAEVARLYFSIRQAQALTVINAEDLEISRDLVRIAESRERNGVATQFDRAAARADLAGGEARILQLQSQEYALTQALAVLLNRPPGTFRLPRAETDRPVAALIAPASVPSELARRRPDLLAAEARLNAALADVGAARADFYPRVSLTGGAGFQAFDLVDLGNWSSRRFNLGPTFHLPIFDGGRLRGTLAVNRAREQLAANDYQQAVSKAFYEVDTALERYQAEQRRGERLRSALVENRLALTVAQRGYEEGAEGFTKVLLARRSLLASQSDVAENATEASLAFVSLYRALGGGWPDLRAAPTEGAGA